MESEELIYDLFDGNLDSDGEARLFSDLAGNIELRGHFMRYLAVKTTIPRDVEAYAPAAQTTAQLLSKLNIQIPSAQAVATQGSAWSGLWAKYQQGILSSLATLGLTILPVLYSMTKTLEHSPVTRNTRSAEVKENVNRDNKEMPALQEPLRENVSSVTEQKTVIVYRDIQHTEKESTQNTALQADAAGETHADLYAVHHIPEAAVPFLPVREQKRIFPAGEVNMSQMGQGIALNGLSVQVRSLYPIRLYPDRPITESQQKLFNNTALAVLYRISESSSVGVEIGQEFLPMNRADAGAGTDVATYTYTPGFFFAGLAWQYAPAELELIPELRPFTQLSANYTYAGPQGRILLGLKYGLMDKIDISAGLDFSSLAYRYGSYWGTTEKLGLTYSMMLRF